MLRLILSLSLVISFLSTQAQEVNPKHGKIKVYYQNSRLLRYKGQYKDYKKDGQWNFYNYDQTPWKIENWKQGVLNGPYWQYNESGALMYEGEYKNGRPAGVWKYYLRNGTFYKDVTYTDSTTIEREYSDNKQLVMEKPKLMGTAVGPYFEYYPDGSPKTQGYYRKGQQDSVWKKWNKDHTLIFIAHYSNGIPEDTFKTFYDNGAPKVLSVYAHGKHDGPLMEWYPDNKMKIRAFYHDNLLDSVETKWYSNGQKLSEIHYSHGVQNGPTLFWNENGILQSEVNFVNGKRDGIAKEFYPDGQMKENVTYINGLQEGTLTDWYTDGKKHKEANYKNGRLNGPYTEWDSNGKLYLKSNEKNGQPDGYLYTYKDGVLFKRELFDNGKLVKTEFREENGKWRNVEQVQPMETLPSEMPANLSYESSGHQPQGVIYEFVQEQAQYPGGVNALQKYLKESLQYPAGVQAEGTVYLKFVVEPDGSISDVKVIRGIPGLNDEARRLIKEMPRWQPGKMNGKAVRSFITLPVKFSLE